MTIEIKVPTLPESVSDATIAKWYKKVGDTIERDENLVDLETDKVMLEVPAPQGGVIEKIMIEEGATVTAGQPLAILNEQATAAAPAPAAPAEAQAAAPTATAAPVSAEDLSPAVRRLVAEKGVDISQIQGSGKSGKITKEDVEQHLQKAAVSAHAATTESAPAKAMGARDEERVPMSRLRQRVAERLVQVQHEAAILTTFNEVNMKPAMDLRRKYKDQFEKTHGIRLGFMSLFTKAVTEALKRYPAANASIDGKELVYHNFCDVGIAIGSPRGLVVPVLRNAEMMSLADIEKQIKAYANQASDGKLAIEDMTGGTFTITNGGVYGSMLSTPIINPPQTGILGMHNIVERPVVENGEIVIRPIMYIALSYDHRVIDGKESVGFLKTVKELIEDPARLLLEI